MVEEIEEKKIRQYLLGELAEAEMSHFEERLMSEDELFERLLVVEDELIDERAAEELSAEEQARFDNYFLATPQRRERLELACALHEYAAEHPAPKPVENATGGGATGETTNATPTETPIKPDGKDVSPPAPLIRPSPWSSSRPYLSLAAAAVILIAVGIVAWLIFRNRPEVSKGLQALNQAYRQQRPTEARITGFDYAPLSERRGNNGPDQVDTLERDRAELTLLNEVKQHPGANTYHAMGLVYLTKHDFDKAIEYLDKAVRLDEKNAKLHSDLGAAYLERATTIPDKLSMNSLAESLEQLNRAIEIDGSLLAAYFNKALCLQRMNALMLAREAWEDYLKKDGNSEWSKEAEKNLRLLEGQGMNNKSPEEVYQDFLAAYRQQNKPQAWRIQSQTKEMITGTMIPFQLARKFLAASLSNPVAAGEEILGAFRFAGELEQKQAGDPFVTELAEFYSVAGRKNAPTLEQAQEALHRGYQLCLQGRYSDAGQTFANAQNLFLRAGNHWESRVVDYWLAYCLSQQGEMKKSSARLLLLAEDCRNLHYRWLEAQSYCWLANNSGLLGEYSQQVERNQQALSLAVTIGDLYNTQKASSQLGEAYKSLGRLQEALEFNQKSLPSAEAYFVSNRQFWRSLFIATDTLFALRLFAAAEAYEQEALRLALNQFHDPVLIHNSYFRLGQIYAGRQDYPAALSSLEESLNTIKAIENDPATQKLLGLSILQTANVKRQEGNYASALEAYQQAAEKFEARNYGLYMYITHKGMCLCHLLNKDALAVEKELPVVLSLFEQNRRQIKEEQNRNHFFDTEQSIYDLAIDYEYDRQNSEQGFNYAEFSRARSLLDAITAGTAASRDEVESDVLASAAAQPLNLSQLKQRLPANLQLIEYAVLHNRLLIWIITQTLCTVIEQPVPAAVLEAATNEYLQVLTLNNKDAIEREQQLAAQLHDWLLAPLESYLNKEDEVAIVPDKFLFKIPFAALLSRQTDRRVINDYTLLYAPSATVLVLCSDMARMKTQNKEAERLLSVGDPLFNRQQHPRLRDLPTSAFEVRQIAPFYCANSAVFIGKDALKEQIEPELRQVDVIHFATHYLADEFSPARSRLLLTAKANTADDDLCMQEIQGMRLPRARVAILSACQSGIERYYAGEGLIGLARAFVAAHIPLVVASQWAVESESTANLMIDFHRRRKTQNLSTTQALCQAQREMLNNGDERYRRPFYWAAFFTVGGHASY
jgi:CHAT domain-containing protein